MHCLLYGPLLVPGKKEKVVVRSQDYQSKLVEQGNLNFIATGKVQETGRIITTMRVATVHNPKLTVQVCCTFLIKIIINKLIIHQLLILQIKDSPFLFSVLAV